MAFETIACCRLGYRGTTVAAMSGAIVVER
jgi:hypothetical protein